MKESQWRLESTTVSTPSNRQSWLTFLVEETMKRLNSHTRSKKEMTHKKVYFVLALVAVLFFSACSQQPTPEQKVESQGFNTWSFPQENVVSGISAYHPVLSVVTDSSNNPLVAYKKSSDETLRVKRWLNNSWQDMGGQLNTSGTWVSGLCGGAALAKNGNTPIIAYYEQTSNSYKVYVKRWNGSSWVSYGAGSALNINVAKYAYQPTLAVDSSGNPTVAWTENDDNTSVKVFAKRWNGSSWDTLGTSGILHASAPQLAIGDNGKPVLAYLKCMSGDDFNCTNKDLYVARREMVEIKPSLFVMTWNILGQTLESTPAVTPSGHKLAVYNNEPVVTWLEGSGYIYVKRHGQLCLRTGCSPFWWELGKGSGYAHALSLGINSAGEPIIAYTACEGSSDLCLQDEIRVVRVISKTNWASIGANPLNALTNDVRSPVLSVTGKSYTVAWLEFGSDASYSDIHLEQYTTLILQPF
jgi:hypothetical protein